MNKIRIEDLSVGDWVQDKKGSIAQIIGIENWSDGYVLNVRINGIDIGCVSANAIEPIPLTQEILKKNGFEEKEVKRKSRKRQLQEKEEVEKGEEKEEKKTKEIYLKYPVVWSYLTCIQKALLKDVTEALQKKN